MASIKPSHSDIVYKTLGNLDISLDLYLPSQTSKPLPILVWFHGGGLLQGHRAQLAPWMRKASQKGDLAVISADYRLAPQASVQDIYEDVLACVAFVRTKLASHVGQGKIDPSRIAVSGSSAGGYLALVAGLFSEPKPSVILPIYPITDPLGTFFITRQPPPMGRPLADASELAEFLDPKAPQVANNPMNGTRSKMYVRMMHDANLARLWHVPEGEAADKFRLSRQVYGRRCCPTYVLHGDADSCVGVEQGDEIVGALLGCGIEVEYERPHGKDHFLDTGDEYANEKFWEFMWKHL